MTRALVAFGVLVVVFGTTFGAIKVGIVDGWPPLLAAGLRFSLAGAIVLGLARATGRTKRLTRAELVGVASVGLTVTTITFGALYSAERYIRSGLAAVLSATGPLFAVMLAVRARERRLDASAIAGIVVATIGVALVSGVGAIGGAFALAASLAIVLSEIAFAWGLAKAKPLRRTISALQLAGAQQLIGGGVLLVLSLAIEHRGPTHVGGEGLAALAYLVVIGSALGHTLGIWLAGATSATFASSWTYISPFLALLLGALMLHESPSPEAWIGGALVIAGALVLNRDLRASLVRAPAP